MNNKITIIILFFIILLLFLYLLKLKNSIITLSSNFDKIEVLKEYSMGHFEKEDFPLDSNFLIITEGYDTIPLISLISSKPKLVFVYKNIDCQSCIDEVFKRLIEFNKKIGKDNIIILSDFKSYRDLIAFKRMNRIDNSFYEFGHFTNSFERIQDQPYLFILDPDFSLKSYFTPVSTYPDLINYYFNFVESKLKK